MVYPLFELKIKYHNISFTSDSKLSISSISPFFMTKITTQSLMVSRRWAIVITVESFNFSLTTFHIVCSVAQWVHPRLLSWFGATEHEPDKSNVVLLHWSLLHVPTTHDPAPLPASPPTLSIEHLQGLAVIFITKLFHKIKIFFQRSAEMDRVLVKNRYASSSLLKTDPLYWNIIDH